MEIFQQTDLGWTSRPIDAIRKLTLVNLNRKPKMRIMVSAPEKGFGKTTVAKYIAQSIPEFSSTDIDVLEVLAFVLRHGADVHKDFASIIKNLYPQMVKDKDQMSTDYYNELRNVTSLFSLIFNVIGAPYHPELATGFDMIVGVIPVYDDYVKQFTKRKEAMLSDTSNSKEFLEHIKRTHVVLSNGEFDRLVENWLKLVKPQFVVRSVTDSSFGSIVEKLKKFDR